jgi:hypothetical protein
MIGARRSWSCQLRDGRIAPSGPWHSGTSKQSASVSLRALLSAIQVVPLNVRAQDCCSQCELLKEIRVLVDRSSTSYSYRSSISITHRSVAFCHAVFLRLVSHIYSLSTA